MQNQYGEKKICVPVKNLEFLGYRIEESYNSCALCSKKCIASPYTQGFDFREYDWARLFLVLKPDCARWGE